MTESEQPAKTKRKPALAQSDVPSLTLNETLRVARAIADHLAKAPSAPLHVAAAMGVQPTTGPFRTITAASTAYGLTDGGAWAETISLTDLGKRIVAPTVEDDDTAAMREAVMRPRLIREFLTRYDGSKWPRDDIAANMLVEMGAPQEQAARALAIIKQNAQDHGLLTTISGVDYVSLTRSGVSAAPGPTASPAQPATPPAGAAVPAPGPVPSQEARDLPAFAAPPAAAGEPQEAPPVVRNENRRVFITHGKDKAIVDQIKMVLSYGDFEPVVAEEIQSTAVPVPDKVLDGMRACSAAVVHVGAEHLLIDKDGHEVQKLNDNVLIEIGAAMALYRRRFILLVEDGVRLPSNLQGLYEVRYKGGGLDHGSTMALLKAFAGFKQTEAT